MSIQPPNGILDITGATLRVSKMEFSNVTGFDTVLNNVARNTVLHVDTTEYTANVAYAVKPPNMFMAQFDLELAAGGTGLPCNFNYYNDSNLGTSFNGYNLSFNDTSIILTYDGGSALHTATLSSSLNNGVYRKVKVLFDRDTTLVSINGENVFRFKDTLRPRTYDTGTTGYIRWWHNSPVARKIKNLKVSNGEKWAQEYDSAGLSSNISYTHGLVGVGTSVPEYTLDVAGDIRASGNLIVNGSNTLINTTSLAIEDNVIECGKGNSSAAKDLGFLMVRNDGSSTTNSNVAMFWDESTDTLTFGFSDSGPTATTLTPNTTKTLKSYFVGNVGIGTDNPGELLTLYGTSHLKAHIESSGAGTAAMLLKNTNGQWTIGNNATTADLELSSSAGTKVYFKQNGNVGIGTASPDTKLHVAGTITISNGSQANAIRTDSDGNLQFLRNDASNDTPVITINDDDGNVGVGTASPSADLQVAGSSATNYYDGQLNIKYSEVGTSSNIAQINFEGSDGTTNRGFGFIRVKKSSNVSGNHDATMSFGVRPNGGVMADDMTILHNGNVGIGTTNPLSALEIYGTYSDGLTICRAIPGSPGASMRLWSFDNNNYNNHNAGTPVGTINFSGNERLTGDTHTDDSREFSYANTLYDWARISALYVGSTNTSTSQGYVRGDLAFYTNNGNGSTSALHERMRIKHDGNVGIGEASPAELLHIRGAGPHILVEGASNENPQIDFSSGPSYRTSRHQIESRHYALSGNGYRNWLAFNVNEGGETTPGTRMVIRGDGRVGIATDGVVEKLHVHENLSTSGHQICARMGGSASSSYNTLVFGSEYGRPHIGAHRSDYGAWADLSFQNGLMVLENTRNMVGIRKVSPSATLHIKCKQTNSYANGIRLEAHNATNQWDIYLWGSVGQNLEFSYNQSTKCHMIGTNSGNIALNFTGQHRTFIKDIPFTQAENLEGLIVSADNNKFIKMSGGIEAGSNAITTNESLPVVSISTKSKDKKCFGVISASEDPENRQEQHGNIVSTTEKELGDTRVYINSVGEGAVWVTNINGNLESGDYITTSNVSGYGMKQDSEFLANYTVAKITMDCDFEPVTQPIQTIKKELGNVIYWTKTTYSNVSAEAYSNLTEDNRRTITTTRYSNEGGEISPDEYSNLESNVQATYTEIETITYQEIERRETKKDTGEGYETEVREELVNVLDEHGQIQWEDHPTETEKAYKIRYLDADGKITTEANKVYTAAFVGCTYHCG